MTVIELEGPAAEPVTLVEAKRFARIERDDEDALILALVKAARESVEQATGLVLARRRMRLCVDAVPADGILELRRGPVRAIETITAYDRSGTAQAFGPGGGTILADRARIVVAAAVRALAWNGLELEVDVGLDAGAVPEPLRLAMLRIVATSYEIRAAVAPGLQPGIVSAAADGLIAPYRRVSLR